MDKYKLEKKIHKTRDKKRHKRDKTIKRPIFHKETPKKHLTHSYSPTINQDLITLASIPREDVDSCNLKEAFQLKEPLKIQIPNKRYYMYNNEICKEYFKPEAEEILLANLKANKHVDPKIIVPPIQSHGNCWFNAFFVTFFISDKGRKFFHFLRQLMIKGIQKNKSPIPNNLRDAFALLNFAVDSCLQGSDFAYELDTNSIIFELFRQIPDSYKEKYPQIVNVDDAGNPVTYYMSIINYLNNNSIQLLFLRYSDITWKDTLANAIKNMSHLPHIIIIEIFEDQAKKFNRKPISFKVNNTKYQLDSAVIRDTEQEHFCAAITCEGKEMGYDGMSTRRLVPFEWKKILNTDYTWEFGGSNHANGKPMQWNFMKSYQLLTYYRVE
jgi:hypothetical protein